MSVTPEEILKQEPPTPPRAASLPSESTIHEILMIAHGRVGACSARAVGDPIVADAAALPTRVITSRPGSQMPFGRPG